MYIYTYNIYIHIQIHIQYIYNIYIQYIYILRHIRCVCTFPMFLFYNSNSLQTPRLPASDPAYPWTCSNPCVELAFFYFPKPNTQKP